MDYIARDTAIKIVGTPNYLNLNILFALKTVPSLKIVRCRDCIHLSGVTNGGTFFRCDRYDRWQDESNRVYMPLDGFCSYGQEKGY